MPPFLRRFLRRTPQAVCDPAFDGATWLTRARRALAGRGRADPATAGWDRTLPEHMRSAAVPGACAGLDAFVADLSPAGSGDVQAVDLSTVDAALARAFASLNASRRGGNVPRARQAGATALARLCVLAGHADPEGLARAAGFSDDRSAHLATALGRRDPFEGRMPSGTLAHAAGSLEALAFRLARDGALGAAAVPRHPWTEFGSAPPFPYGFGGPSYGRALV